ncbi:HepT-like ribonuclease domain-containing protein, partial [Leptospira soteropolitanensis]
SATRNHLIHGYFIVDYDIVWDLVKNKIPILEIQIKEILQKEKNTF